MMTIVDKAIESDSFTILVMLVTEANLVDFLSGEGPFTLFAPTDDAFDALPDGTVEFLLQPENSEQLIHLLKYHVVSANAVSESLSSGEIETLNGEYVMVNVSEGGVMVNDATVIIPDIIASNGIIHGVDKVLMPQLEQPTQKPTSPPTVSNSGSSRSSSSSSRSSSSSKSGKGSCSSITKEKKCKKKCEWVDETCIEKAINCNEFVSKKKCNKYYPKCEWDYENYECTDTADTGVSANETIVLPMSERVVGLDDGLVTMANQPGTKSSGYMANAPSLLGISFALLAKIWC